MHRIGSPDLPGLEIIPSWEHGGIIQRGAWPPSPPSPPRTRKYPYYVGAPPVTHLSPRRITDFSSFYSSVRVIVAANLAAVTFVTPYFSRDNEGRGKEDRRPY